MKICLVGGIFDRPEAVRSKQLVTSETVSLDGFRKAGVEVHAVGHAGFQPSDEYDIICVHHFGMAAVEAQACGKPVVSSDSGDLNEVVPSNCGARVPVGDSAKMADEIEKLVDDSDLYAAFSANALINAATYDWAPHLRHV
jgi:glycosyltransferase involved in cell wall biosynthesis